MIGITQRHLRQFTSQQDPQRLRIRSVRRFLQLVEHPCAKQHFQPHLKLSFPRGKVPRMMRVFPGWYWIGTRLFPAFDDDTLRDQARWLAD